MIENKKKIGRPKGSTVDMKQLILNAAFKLFSTQGFAGTSVNQIAKAADVNQSLLYHHYKNKLDLWRAIKNQIFEKHNPKYLNPSEFNTLEELITEYVTSRFDFYYQHPEILRLILWQRLDTDHFSLATKTEVSSSPIFKALKHFQDSGEISSTINVSLLIIMISNMSIAPLVDCPELLEGTFKEIVNYKEMVIQTILNGIKVFKYKIY